MWGSWVVNQKCCIVSRTPGAKSLRMELICASSALLSPSFFLYPSLLLALGGETETLRILLDHGGDVNAPDEEGYTPVHVASRTGQAATLKILLEYNGNVNTPDTTDGSSPIWSAGEKRTP